MYTIPVLRPKAPSSALRDVILLAYAVGSPTGYVHSYVGPNTVAGSVIAKWDGGGIPSARHVI
jgi:hypothetical protein